MLPTEWAIESFERIARFDAGRTPPRANPIFWQGSGEHYPWVAISDMDDYGIITRTAESVTQAAFDQIFRGRLVHAGTLIMSFKLTIGRVATLGVDAFHNEAIISIHPGPGVDQRYLGYFLSHVDYAEHQDRQVKGNTLNQDKLNRILVSLPPKTEQSRIADVLDCVRDAILLQRRLLQKADELKRTTIRKLLTSGLRGEASKETEVGLIPESWKIVKLGSLGRVGNGSTPKKSIAEYWMGAYPWLTSAKVYDREILQADQFVTARALAECHLPRIKPGAVLIAITGQGKTLGHCAVLGIEATINQHIAYVAIDTTRANPAFLRGYLETQYQYLRQVGSGGGSTKGALTCAFLRSLPIPLPLLDEQREIVAVLDVIDQKIDCHQRKQAILENLFKALLDKLLTGEVRTAELNLPALKSETNSQVVA